MSASTHNVLAPELVKRLILEAGDEADAMVVLESVILGVMFFYRPAPAEAAEFLDSMTMRVIERMAGPPERGRATSPGSLLREPGPLPPGCYCSDICMAPRMMGRQMPCRRKGGIPGKKAPPA